MLTLHDHRSLMTILFLTLIYFSTFYTVFNATSFLDVESQLERRMQRQQRFIHTTTYIHITIVFKISVSSLRLPVCFEKI